MGRNIGIVLSLRDKFTPDIKKVAQSVGKTENEVKKARMEIIKFQNGLKNVAQKAAVGFGVAMTAAAARTISLVQKTVEAGDRIDKMSQKMQMSRQAFQELDYVFAQNGADIGIMQKGAIKLSKAMVDASQGGKNSVKMFKSLGISVKDSSGHLRKTEDVLLDTLSTLQKMPDDANRAKIANDLLGKSASELSPLINKGSKDLNVLRKQFRDLGMGMSDKAVDSAVLFGDTMDAIGRSLSGVGYKIGADMLPALQSVTDIIIANMPQIRAVALTVVNAFSGGIKFLADNMNWLLPIAGGVLSSILAYNAINGVITTVSALQGIIKSVTLVQGVWNAVMLANPIGLIALGIGALIGVIALLIANWDKVTAAARRAWQIMKNVAKLTPMGFVANAVIQNQKTKKPHHATDTSYSRAGIARVGERGPEDVILPGGAKVVPNNKISSNRNVNVTVNIHGNMVGNQGFVDSMCNQIAQVIGKKMAVC